MPIFEWQNKFSTGIDKFDDDHQYLFGLLNSFYDSFIERSHFEKLGTILDELVDYATYHMAAEEQWMKLNKYPKYAEHLTEHNFFAIRVKEIQGDFTVGRKTLSLEILAFMKNWLIGHILTTDADYGMFASKRQEKLQFKIRR